ncbi:MAG: T9SS type A sorting domain-containing protein [Crocinitomicaceae bacterium]
MKILNLIVVVFASVFAYSQSETEMPYSFKHSIYNIRNTEVYNGNPLDVNALLVEDAMSGSDFPRAGKLEPVNINLNNSGTWYDLPSGDKLWRLKLKVPNALAVSAYFDDLMIPQGGKLYAYSPDYNEVLEVYTSENNPESGFYATDYVHGDVIVLEYIEPYQMLGAGRISLNGLNGFYTMIEPLRNPLARGDDRAGTCQVDVNCSEGNNWRPEIDGVVRITVLTGGDTGFCSGSLVNNTAEDCTPYVLSAHHCATDDNNINASAADFAQWIFRFNFQRSSCGVSVISGSYSKVGCAKIANSTNNGGILGSDYLLVELSELLDESKMPYFNGWDASGLGSSSGVQIHHPAGDEKKISTYNQNLTTSNWPTSPSGSHWRVKWIATPNGHGISEGGSSGSPIFNAEKLIIGQLSGGQSECADVNPNGQTLPDLCGKMSYNWTGNANVDLIGPYLDPIGNGTTKVMQGNYYLCSQGNGTVNGINDYSDLENLVLFPNPSKNTFALKLNTADLLDVKIFNQIGQEVVSFTAYEVGDPINISYLSGGIYYVKVGNNGIWRTEKMIVL